MVLQITFFALFGMIIGSFMNAVIYRFPRKISISKSRSHCPSCDKLIYWYENIPVLSYIFLRGKCSGCGAGISIQYPLVELISGVASVLLMPKIVDGITILHYVFYFTVFECFLAHFIIDVRHKLLPNALNIYLALIFGSYGLMQFPISHVVYGGAIGLLFPLGFTYAFYLVRGKIGLGGGDIKLWGALGFYLGIKGIIFNIFFSCFLGSIIGVAWIALKRIDKGQAIPFGPFILVISFLQIYFPAEFQALTRLVVGF
jgi:prepilin signal peptidase PulO-like enzyme (type II secretory pathway)